ncbi:MAG: acyl--CoA ligase [Methylacidiphilales bacterium]|nr:acyl--CoA ligase [Candidatus Methylacidiphilales bacterium]
MLWTQWEKTLGKNKRRILLIEADSDTAWTARTLTEKAHEFFEALSGFERGTRVAFCLPNGAQWIAFFLALQKLGLAATPLDAGLPGPACLEMAQRLRCRALFLHGKFHALDPVAGDPKAPACIKVTSGASGGPPKNVPCQAEHLIADGSNIIRTMGIRPRDRNLAVIPLGHSYGLGNLVLPLILQGTPLVCAGRFVPRQLIDWIGFYRITVFPSVPAIFRALASMPGKSRLAPLRLAISAGAPLTAEVARAFFERYRLKIRNFYGSSETGGICYDRGGDAALSGRSVGKPLAGVKVTVHRGAIEVESASVAKRNRRWRVPDRGEWNDRGELVLLGRLGREVNLGGKKVHPSEVEQALRTVPGVSDAVVWVAAHAERAFLQAAVETRLPLADVQRALAARLPEWMLPKRYALMPELPRTGRGKADMAALRRKIEG